jgi:glycerol-3-phosphate cytidylyltransferase
MSVTGYTAGVYDLFHVGHLNLLRRAKAECDRLIVGVTTDELALANKNKKPIIPFTERCEILRELRCVDLVVPQVVSDKFSAWERYRYNKIFVGDDWKGHPVWSRLEQSLANVGAEVVYFSYTPHVSSSSLRQYIAMQGFHGGGDRND